MQQQKYGLQLRVKPQQQAKKPPLPTKPLLFGQDEDDDNVEKEISRHASKNKSLKDIEEMHKKALEEDPSAFDYDGVYDDMKQKVAQPRHQDRQERKPKYIEALMKKAEIRQREHEIIYEKKLTKERTKDDHLYADKDKFVTSAYKKKLAEQAKWMEEERLRQLKEEKDDVTKKSDLSDFYFNLGKNVAFGAKEIDSRKQEKQTELRKSEKLDDEAAGSTSGRGRPLPDSKSIMESSRVNEEHHDGTSPVPILPRRNSESSDVNPVSERKVDTSVQENTATEEPLANQPKQDHHKRNEDTVAAAKERFLARKKAKQQL
ncbi:nuclear speckle splicing regulatory protein 1 [Ricinus communis]|nr:nuclear speckle splicing regulatory protein 1 [Ricinus communis]|eukprot:XP_015577645.1 nuclear speckle splicing regulatory protein 1 isoform X2 [Ricinus communis]